MVCIFTSLGPSHIKNASFVPSVSFNIDTTKVYIYIYILKEIYMRGSANSNTAETLLKRVTSPGDRNVNKPSRCKRFVSQIKIYFQNRLSM